MVDTATEVRFLLFCLKSVTTTSFNGTFLLTIESGASLAIPPIAREANNNVFSIKTTYLNVFVPQRYGE